MLPKFLLPIFLSISYFSSAQESTTPPAALTPPPKTESAKPDATKSDNKKADKKEKLEKLEKIDKLEKAEKSDKDSLDFLDNIDYPELQVVPRASERLESEAQFEREGGSWLNQWSFLLSGTSTLAAATLTQTTVGSSASVDQQNAIKLAQIVGGLTLGVGVYYGFAKPYESTLEKVRRVRGKDKRSVLLRERTAEEALERTASTIGSISTISVWANLIVAGSLATFGDTNSKTYAYAALFASTLSMMFTHPYILNWEKHKEYKHKIYSPLPQAAVTRDPKTGQIQSYLGLTWNF